MKALHIRHGALVKEFARRGYNHRTPLDKRLARGVGVQTVFVDSPLKQLAMLKRKRCGCLWKS